MLTNIKKVAATSALLVGLSGAPVIPSDMELLYSYQFEVGSERKIYGDVADESTKRVSPDAVFEDTDGDGLISVSVFSDKNGNEVYIQLSESKFTTLATKGGYERNPTKEERLSVFKKYLAPKKVRAAIAFDSQTNPDYGNTTAYIFALDSSSSDGITFVGTWERNGDPITGVTYDGSAMTAVADEEKCGAASGQQDCRLWYIIGTDGTSSNVSVNSSGTGEKMAGGVSYSGACQTDVPDATSIQAYQTGIANTSGTITTISDNAWVLWVLRIDRNTAVNAGVDTTRRAYKQGRIAFFDGGSSVTPAGSETLNSTHVSDESGGQMVSFAPASGGTCGGAEVIIIQEGIIWY